MTVAHFCVLNARNLTVEDRGPPWSFAMASPEEEASPFKLFKAEGKRLLKEGKVRDALSAFEKAVECRPDDRLQEKMKRMREYLETEADQEAGDDDMVDIGQGFSLYRGIESKLYAYQREGVLWMWGLYMKKKGGILGDDMGLGKTIQVVAFLSGMFDSDLVKSVLLVMPVSLISNWKKEFELWAPGIPVFEYHTGTKRERERSLAKVQTRGGVLITSYGMLQANSLVFCPQDGKQFVWCYLILDEGHKIKNPTKTAKAVCEVPAKNRLVLTGTAVQNNLQELWALFNFTHQGTLVGSLTTFKRQYEIPINRARERDATAGERLLGTEIATQLRKLIQPYFLRRTKAEVLEDEENTEDDKASLRPKLTFTSKKNDLVIWIYLTELQRKIYREFLESEEVANILMTKKSPLVQLTILKKICDHPRLLSKRACVQMGMYDDMTKEEIEKFLDEEEATSLPIKDVNDDVLVQESGKMKFVLQLLTILRDEGHRTLLFSQSRKILDLIQRILTNRHFKIARLDGTVNKLCERDRIVANFQTKNDADVFLLTTQVGGVGLTLTSADRVIIYDPSWNPATDAQAVDRAYRIGQHRNVVVYRLITCSTVEEKIYRRQTFKDSIIKQTTGKQKDPMRYFSKQELKELFTLEDPNYSCTQVHLAKVHSRARDTSPSLEGHIAVLQKENIFGVSHHDRMFSEESEEVAEEELVPGEIEHMKERAKIAQRLISAEANQALTGHGTVTSAVPTITVKERPQPKPVSKNIVPIVVANPDDGTSRKPVFVPDDNADDVVCIDDVSSINKSFANMSVCSLDTEEFIVEDSEVELFGNSDPEDSVVIESGDHFSDSVETQDDISETRLEEPSLEIQERKNTGHPVNVKQEGIEESLTTSGKLASSLSREYQGPRGDFDCFSADQKAPCCSEEEDEGKKNLKFALSDGTGKPTRGPGCQCLFEDDVEMLDNGSLGASLCTTEPDKKHVKRSLWRLPKESSFVDLEAEHPIRSPSALQGNGTGSHTVPAVLSPLKAFVAQPRLQSTPRSSPVKAFVGQPQATPSKRITPLFVGSPQQQMSSPLHSLPASPFQEALARSVEYPQTASTPLKQEAAPSAHSNQASVSVHMVSVLSEGKEDADESASDDDIVVVRRRKKVPIVDSDSSDDAP